MNATTNLSRQYPGLELLRTLAALLVVLWHYKFFYATHGVLEPRFFSERPPLYPLLWPGYDYGYLGVQVFWCLSGFIFFWRYLDRIQARIVDVRNFFILRFSRLYPLHLVTLLLLLGLQAVIAHQLGHPFMTHDHDWQDVLAHLFMASGWGLSDWETLNEPAWSVSVELLIYFCFFFLTRWLGGNFGMLIMLFMGWLLLSQISDSRIMDCGVLFYAGGLVHAIQRRLSSTLYRSLAVLVPLGLATACLGLMGRWNFLTLVLGCVSLLALSAWLRLPGRLETLFMHSGQLTYSIYLIQLPVQAAIFLICHQLGIFPDPDSLLFFTGYLAFLYWASARAYQYLEAPAQAWLRKRMS